MIRIIGGHFRRHGIENPGLTLTGVRPTTDRVREAMFNILAHTFSVDFENTKVLDAFAGSGALGLEALSRGSAHVHFCEKNLQVQKILAKNIQKLGLERQSRLWTLDSLNLPQAETPVELIFLDPPYKDNLLPSACLHLLAMGWVHDTTIICAESAKKSTPQFPEFLEIQEQRNYGQSTLSFLVPSSAGIDRYVLKKRQHMTV
jgi:16S rRNA (guanine966-N2)-methyltransferase